jgi:hypothetical protein
MRRIFLILTEKMAELPKDEYSGMLGFFISNSRGDMG